MIGIVGGVGPFAGIDLFKKITEQTKAGRDQEHLPVILFSFPGMIEDRTAYINGEVTENPGIAIAKICIELSKAGATIAGIPCSTAHAPEIFNCILNELTRSECKLKIVNMIDETIKYISQILPHGSLVGILTTTGAYKQKVYYNPLSEAGYVPVTPDEDVISELVHNSVYHPSYGIKTQGGKITGKAKKQLYKSMDIISRMGAQSIILGCSEIPLAIHVKEYKGMRLIDPTSVLARAMIEEYEKSNTIPENS